MKPSLPEIEKALERYEDKVLDERLLRIIGPDIRQKHCLTAADLYLIVCWKSYRVSSASRSVKENEPDTIRAITKEAFTKLEQDDDVEGAIDSCKKLHWVKERVASAIFTFYNPEKYGVMDRYAFRSLSWSDTVFSTKYREYLTILRDYRKEFKNRLSCHQIDTALYQIGKERAR